MRNIKFYHDRISEAESLADIEKYLAGGLKQAKTDQRTLIEKRERLLNTIKTIESDLKKFKDIEKCITDLSKEKVKDILLRISHQ